MKRFNQKGFAIVELFLVVVLIVVIAGISLFIFNRSNNDKNTKADVRDPAKSRQKIGKKIVYQVHIPFYQHDSLGQRNAFDNITSRLDGLASMGVNVIQLTPVHTSSYLVLDHYDVSWKYTGKTRNNQGTKEDRLDYFETYVSKAHDKNMKVMMDCVYHGTAINSPLVTQHSDWYKYDKQGQIIKNNFGIAQFDTSKPEVQDYIIDVTKFWVDKVGIDGCRIDMAHSVPLPLWAKLNNEMKKQKSSWFMTGEAFGKQIDYALPNKESELEGVYGFDGVYDFYLQSVLRGVVGKTRNASEIVDAWKARPAGHKESYYNMIDDQNAVERSATFSGGNSGMVAGMAVNFTLDGIPFIFNGQEIGDTQAGGPKIDETRYYSWENPPHPENRQKFKQLSCLRKNNKSLYGGTTTWLSNSKSDYIVSYLRKRDKQKTLVVVNFSDKTWSGKIKVKVSKKVVNMVNKKTYKSSGKSVNVKLKPYSYYIANVSGSSSSKAVAVRCAK
ncbi:MAG TPA: alpha-amylase family glycosyl hydrolase [Candidatus Saccharibacteria bacterium]|nr:alpha-amylase family glycosyl hydrolase [Candidatus Saccharibacteria bacterium]